MSEQTGTPRVRELVIRPGAHQLRAVRGWKTCAWVFGVSSFLLFWWGFGTGIVMITALASGAALAWRTWKDRQGRSISLIGGILQLRNGIAIADVPAVEVQELAVRFEKTRKGQSIPWLEVRGRGGLRARQEISFYRREDLEGLARAMGCTYSVERVTTGPVRIRLEGPTVRARTLTRSDQGVPALSR